MSFITKNLDGSVTLPHFWAVSITKLPDYNAIGLVLKTKLLPEQSVPDSFQCSIPLYAAEKLSTDMQTVIQSMKN